MFALDRKTFDHFNEGAPRWLANRRNEAFELFSEAQMPTGAEESWRYVEVEGDLHKAELATGEAASLPSGAFVEAFADVSASARVVDGRVSYLQGEHVARLSDRFRDEDLAPVYGSLIEPDRDIFASAHLAFATDGVHVRIPRGHETKAPIVIEVQATEGVSFPHLLVEVGENAGAQVVVVYRSLETADPIVVPGVELIVGDGARLGYLSVQDFSQQTTVVIHERAKVGRDATLSLGEVGLGGRLGRLDLGALLEGAGSRIEVVGLYFGEGEQTLDYRLVITHRGRNTRSDVFLKGAVEDYSQSVFTGLLTIEKDAVRSEAYETNRNLVLSEHAKAHSVPNLEIKCNDVMCGHASSVGPLDEEHLYYVQSRGLTRTRAERLLVRGFFREVIERLPIHGADDPLEAAVNDRFVRTQEAV